MKLSEFGKDFLFSALRIGKHHKNYVDYYIGPDKIRELVDNEDPVSPGKLLKDCKSLHNKVFSQGYDKKREIYIDKMLVAMRTSVELLKGIKIPFKERFLRQYDVTLQVADESELDELKEEINEAYGGIGNLEEKLKRLREKRKIPKSKVLNLFENALNTTRIRTNEVFRNLLPKSERIILELASIDNDEEAKWSYYEWYLGKFRSRIEINPTYNMYWTTILSSATHEAYPGHHTEFVIKEQRLYRDLNHFEHSILLLNSPKLVMSEGIAEIAANMLYSYREQAKISIQNFCIKSLPDESLDILAIQNKVKGKIHLFWYNLAYLALVEDWSEEKLIQYAINYEIYDKNTIKNRLKLIFNQVYSTTVFSYKIGRDIIINKFGEFPSVKDFRALLEKSVLPSDLK